MPELIVYDDRTENLMRSWVPGGNGYVTLIWPKKLLLRELDYCKAVVDFQLDSFRREARRKSDGDIEYESWAAA